MKKVPPIGQAPSGHPPTPLECVTFFNQALERFHQAARACGQTDERLIQIDDLVLRLTFAGSTLSPRLMRELEHRALPSSFPAAPAFTLYVWDDASTHTRMPPPPWLGYDAYTRRGDLRGWNTDRIYTAYSYDVATIYAMDVEQKTAFFWTRDASNLPDYEISAPLRILLHWIGNLYGAQLVHGGAVGTKQGGVLLAGKGGSGKSTTVLSCLTSDLLYVGDNYCWLKAAPVPSIHSAYSSARVHADNLARVPHMLPSLGNANNLATEKATFFLHEHWRAKLISGFPLLAILLPCVTGNADTTLTPATPVEVLKALALSTMAVLPRAGTTSFQLMSKVVQQLPSYHLWLGTDMAQIPGVITRLIERELRATAKTTNA
jgi:hypothetical protein